MSTKTFAERLNDRMNDVSPSISEENAKTGTPKSLDTLISELKSLGIKHSSIKTKESVETLKTIDEMLNKGLGRIGKGFKYIIAKFNA